MCCTVMTVVKTTECQLTEGFLDCSTNICPIKVYGFSLLDQMNDGVRAEHNDSCVVYFGTHSQEMTSGVEENELSCINLCQKGVVFPTIQVKKGMLNFLLLANLPQYCWRVN